MTSIALPGSGLLDNLPLLTQVVKEDSLGDIPILTEIVAESQSVASQESSGTDAVMADDDLLSLLESIEVETPLRDSELKGISVATDKADIASPHFVNDAEMQQLLHQLETHMESVLRKKLSLDTVFTEKLILQLEQLQQMAITQAIDELKAELPNMLRDALNTHFKSRN